MRSLLLSGIAALALSAPLAGAQSAPAAAAPETTPTPRAITETTTPKTRPTSVATVTHVKTHVTHGRVATFDAHAQVLRLTDGRVFHLLHSAHTRHLRHGTQVTLRWHFGKVHKHTRYVSALKIAK